MKVNPQQTTRFFMGVCVCLYVQFMKMSSSMESNKF